MTVLSIEYLMNSNNSKWLSKSIFIFREKYVVIRLLDFVVSLFTFIMINELNCIRIFSNNRLFLAFHSVFHSLLMISTRQNFRMAPPSNNVSELVIAAASSRRYFPRFILYVCLWMNFCYQIFPLTFFIKL